MEIDRSERSRDARLLIYHSTASFTANSTGLGNNYLGCKLRRQEKDVVCRMGGPGTVKGPIPLITTQTSAKLFLPLEVRNLTLRRPTGQLEVSDRRFKGEELCETILHFTNPNQPATVPGTSSSGMNAIRAQPFGDAECKIISPCREDLRERTAKEFAPLTCTRGWSIQLGYDFKPKDQTVYPSRTTITVRNQYWLGVGNLIFGVGGLFMTKADKRCEPNCGVCSPEEGCVWRNGTWTFTPVGNMELKEL
jgi:hypothetical protein